MITAINFKKTFRAYLLLTLSAALFLFAGCKKEEAPPTAEEILQQRLAQVDPVQLATDLAIIDDTLAVRGLTDSVLIEPNGVRYQVKTMGSGVMPTLESVIRIKYSGKFLSTGEEFDSSDRRDFFLYELITGFQTALPLVPKGTVVTLYIPSGYGYGPQDRVDGAGNVVIPGNAILVFDIELQDVF